MDQDFGRWVRRERARRPLTQEELAARAGVSIRTVQLLESGRSASPRPDTRRRIAAALAATAPRAAEPTGGPAQLPRDVPGFTGRGAALDALDRSLLDAEAGIGPTPVAVVTGPAGVGKTALAVHWGHRVAGRFPDGQLHVDLRGYDPDRPVPPAGVLPALLRALGADPAGLPHDTAELAARYRTLLAGRRVLVLLDNAATAEQVRPLLPGDRSCFVLVTSRDSLPGLVARDGAQRFPLDLLEPDEAVALLRAVLDTRVRAEPAAAGRLAAACARLPLALRIVAERAAAQPGTALAGLAGQLTDEHRRLDLLEVDGDERSAVRTVFSWSYRQLAGPAACAFRRLGLHPGRAFERADVAALIDAGPDEAGSAVDELVRVSLAGETGPGRYAMHDLLAAYARERSLDEPPEVRQAALTRLLDTLVAGTAAAMDALAPYERERRRPVPPAARPGPGFAGADEARSWLDARRGDLAAAAGAGSPGHAAALANLLWRYFDVGAHHVEALAVYGAALTSATDPAVVAAMHRQIGVAYARTGRYAEGAGHLDRAVAGFRTLGDRAGAAAALHSRGALDLLVGKADDAQASLDEALRIFEETGDRLGAAQTLGNLAGVHHRRGDYAATLRAGRRAMDVFAEIGDVHGIGRTAANLGTVYERLGRLGEALDMVRQALDVFRRTGNAVFEGRALTDVARVYRRLGRTAEAREHAERALDLLSGSGDHYSVTITLEQLGLVAAAQGRHADATGYLRRALDVAGELGPDRLAALHNAFGEVHAAAGRPGDAAGHHRRAEESARRGAESFELARALAGRAGTEDDPAVARACREESLRLYEQLGLPEADALRAGLSRTPPR